MNTVLSFPGSWRASLCGLLVASRGTLAVDRVHPACSAVSMHEAAPVRHDGLRCHEADELVTRKV